jgi:reactive intermediate/imine deaminase
MEPAAVILDRYAAIRRIRGLSRLLDTHWTLPGTRWRFGLDPLLGLVPVVGDVVTLGISVWLLIEARRIGAPGRLMARMTVNVVLDFLLGEIPVLGDVFDFVFKAHIRNLTMLENWMARSIENVGEGSSVAPRAISSTPAITFAGVLAFGVLSGCPSRPAAPPLVHLPAQGAIGPYSGSVLASDFCFASGKISAADEAAGPFADEVNAVINAIEQELAQSGLRLEHVVNATCYLTDLNLFGEFNAVYATRFRAPQPARTTVGVSALPGGRRVEIAVIARRPAAGQ